MGKFSGVLIASDYDNTMVYTEGALKSGKRKSEPNPKADAPREDVPTEETDVTAEETTVETVADEAADAPIVTVEETETVIETAPADETDDA